MHGAIYNSSNIEGCLNKFDAFITGSDQVWNYRRTADIEDFLLTFVPDSKTKIAYAASFGVETLPFYLRKMYTKALQRLDAVSIRESSGVRLFRSLTGCDAEHVVDPTLLMPKEDWRLVAVDIELPERFVLLYTLNISLEVVRRAEKEAAMRNLPLVRIGSFYHKSNYDQVIELPQIGPEQFLCLFDKADLVITNSFHGTVFSVNFGKNFFSVLSEQSRQNSRIASILIQLGLEERIVYEHCDNSGAVSSIDWGVTADKLKHFREQGQNFLENALAKSL